MDYFDNVKRRIFAKYFFLNLDMSLDHACDALGLNGYNSRTFNLKPFSNNN